MLTLFPVDPVDPDLPDGFEYYPHFINEAEENRLLQAIAGIELAAFQFQGYEAKRRVASFGYDWSFEKRTLSKGRDIPDLFQELMQKTATYLMLPVQSISELLITEYPAGSVINWHRDAPPFDAIMGISLLTDCTFKLRPYDKRKQSRKDTVSFPLQRRSLYVIKNEARMDWEHSIAPVKAKRYSITLRTLKDNAVF